MNPVTLYYQPYACSLSDHIALKIAKIPYKLVEVNLKKRLTEDGEDYSKISFTGAVPALKLGENQILTQNLAILTYIGKLSNVPSFKPRDDGEWARYLEAISFDTDLHTAVSNWAHFGHDEKNFQRRLSEFDAFLPASGWWLGTSEPSQADIYAAVIVNWAVQENISIDEWPKVKALHKAIFDLDVVKEAIKEEVKQRNPDDVRFHRVGSK